MAVSVGDIDLDSVTLPETYLTEQIDDSDNDCKEPQPKSSASKLTEKWDWNADFIPLVWDGTVTISSLPSHNHNTNSTPPSSPKDSPKLIQPQPKQTPLKN
eukprot:387006_1